MVTPKSGGGGKDLGIGSDMGLTEDTVRRLKKMNPKLAAGKSTSEMLKTIRKTKRSASGSSPRAAEVPQGRGPVERAPVKLEGGQQIAFDEFLVEVRRYFEGEQGRLRLTPRGFLRLDAVEERLARAT